MHLADHRNSIVGQPFGVVKLPQRTTAIKRLACYRTDHGVELSPSSWRGHLYSPKVVVQIDVSVLAPDRAV